MTAVTDIFFITSVNPGLNVIVLLNAILYQRRRSFVRVVYRECSINY